MDFQMPTHNHEAGMPIDLKRTGMCLHMMLYTLDELFYVFWGIGTNDIDGQTWIKTAAFSSPVSSP